MTLAAVAAEVTRRTSLARKDLHLLTSVATVLGFNARIFVWRSPFSNLHDGIIFIAPD
ncbi:MAG: hypothetical protein KIS67_24955 [Verrucomicrobiae bacterium]|nr:hypothetical protein [Verrucomicrobiae bacterium]